MKDDADIVVSAIGVVTSFGCGWERQREALAQGSVRAGSLARFQPEKHLADRRVMKATAFRDAVGVVALEDCLRVAHYAEARLDPERVGLFVGAASASALAASYYEEAMLASLGADGRCDLPTLGRTSMSAKPATLLIGLPNNVLCYGSIAMDARGPNSNYTAGTTSGMLAVINAGRRIQRDQLDLAVAGGYAVPCDDLHKALSARQGEPAEELADGAAFFCLERRKAAVARGLQPMATYLGGAVVSASDANGAMRAALTQARADATDVGLVLASPGSLVTFGRREEASGLVEIGAASELLVGARKPLALILAGSAATGDYACVVIRQEGDAV